MDYNVDESRDIIDKIFKRMDLGNRSEELAAKSTTLTGSKDDVAKALALEELETIRLAFIEFQEKTNELILYNYMTGPLSIMAKYAEDLTALVEDDIDEAKLSPDSLMKYNSIKKLRAQILGNVYKKYKKE